MNNLKKLLPEYPRTIHLPWKPNAVRDDLVAKEGVYGEPEVIFTNSHTYVEEKIDGASCGCMLYEGQAVIRNRTHILNKGYLKDTPAKMQFRPAWTWFYANKEKFVKINKIMGGSVGIYGEWMWAWHGILYDKLPAFFIAYDIFDRDYLDPELSRNLLQEAGFITVPLLHKGIIKDYEQLESFCNEPSAFSTKDKREGVYVKVSDGKYITHRFKMVRSDFVQGCNWNEEKLTKNKLEKKHAS